MASLRVERHPRGHIAACNGRVELLNTRVESYSENRPGNASENALKVDAWTRSENERKAHQLESFQRRVKYRVFQRERERQREIATVSTELVMSEQRAAEKAVKLDRIKVPRSVEIGHDIEDIKVIASAKASHIPQCSGKPTATQIARRNLLTKKVPETSVNEGRTEFEEIVVMSDGGHFPSPHNDTSVHHHVINQLRKESLSQRSRVQTEVTQSCLKHSEQSPTGPHSTLRKFTAPGQLEHAQKKQAAQQYHVFRKYYSDLERAQARQKQLKLTHSQRVEKLKKRKEANRRVIEDEAVVNDSCSFISTEAAEDQRLAAEWAELVATESRRQEEQKSQEMERYIQALKARLKEQLESRKLDVPPLCACGLELWDTNPDTCANNCIFYKNPKAYARALSNLLVSLQL